MSDPQELLYVPSHPGQGTDVAPAFKQSGGGGGAEFALPFFKNFVDYPLGDLGSDFVTSESPEIPGDMITTAASLGTSGFGPYVNGQWVKCAGIVGENSSALYKFPTPVPSNQNLVFQMDILAQPDLGGNQAGMYWGITKGSSVLPTPWGQPKGAILVSMSQLASQSTIYVQDEGVTIASHMQSGSTQKEIFSRITFQVDTTGRIQVWEHHVYQGFFKYYNDMAANAPTAAWLANGDPFTGVYVVGNELANVYQGYCQMANVYVTNEGTLRPWGLTQPDSYGGYL